MPPQQLSKVDRGAAKQQFKKILKEKRRIDTMYIYIAGNNEHFRVIPFTCE